MREWEEYQNGNVRVMINTKNGTKVRQTDDNEWHPAFPENIDLMISHRCDHGCDWCYAGCEPFGQVADLTKWNFLTTLHPHTELAVNLNFPLDAMDVWRFLDKMKNQRIIVNATINEDHFMEHEDYISKLVADGYIHGLGISLTRPSLDFIDEVKKYPNSVIHVVNGIIRVGDLYDLADHGLKILILGYKRKNRGKSYDRANKYRILDRERTLEYYIKDLIPRFETVGFDNLALKQLNVKDILTPEQWERNYMGDDGQFTMAADLVKGTFSRNSMTDRTYPIGDKSVDEMFQIIQREVVNDSGN